MAYYIIGADGALPGTTALDGGTVATTATNQDVLIYNDAEAAVTVTVGLDDGNRTVTIDKKSGLILENVNPTTAADTITLAGGTHHNTSTHLGARVHYFVAGGADLPTLPTDNIDPDS